MARTHKSLLAGLLAATALTSIAYAQDTAPAPAPAEAAADQEDTVLVTAQRRAQDPQKIGVAVTTLSGGELQRKGVNQVNGLEYITPSLEVESQFGSGQPSFAIRGIGFRDYATNNTPTVGIYVDEVAYPLPVMTQGVLFDVERVEVLRGPQGTLYGRNTTGGAINLISAKPTDELQYGFSAEIGRFEAFRAEGYVSGPASDKVRLRLSATTEQGGAWQVNRETGIDLGDKDRLAARLLAEADVTENLDVLLNLHAYYDESDGLGLQLFRPFAPFAAHTGRQTSWGVSPGFAAAVGITPNEKPFRDNDGWGGSATVNYDFGPARLTYIGAYEELDRREFNDYDAVPDNLAATLFESDIEVQSHELRLASTGDQTFDWIVGLYYADETLNEVYNSSFLDSFGPLAEIVRTPYSQEVQTLGIFGQVEYQVTDQLNLIAGLRYEDEDRDLIGLGTFADLCDFIAGNPLGSGTNCANGLIGVLENRSVGLDDFSWRIGAEFEVNENVLFYATISRGLKSGGFTAYNTLNPLGITPFQPEELLAYEVGVKSDLLEDTLRINAAIFYYDYNDQQVQSAIFDAGTGAVVGRIVNAPESEVYGAELELTWAPTDNWTVIQTLGWKQGTFEEFLDLNTAAPPATIDRSGQDIGFPELSYAGSISYANSSGLGFDYTATFDYSYRDEQSFPLLGAAYTIDSYWLANASLAFRPDGSNVEITLWGRNIFDEEYAEQRNFFALPDVTPIEAPGLPATYGVRLSADF